MAEEFSEQATNLKVEGGEGEVKDRGLFDLFHKKKEEEGKKHQEEEGLVTGVEKIHIEEGHKEEEKKKEEKEKKEEEKKHGHLDKLHRTHSSSSSSSSSDEEEEVEGEGGIKEKIKKKKKALKEKLHGGEKKKEEEKKEPAFAPAAIEVSPAVVLEKVDVFEEAALPPEEEKKSFLGKLKEKLPGHGKKTAEEGGAFPPAAAVEVPVEHVKEHDVVEGTEGKEKKGFLGKIMEKLPGYHKNAGEEAEKSSGSH